MFSEIIRNYCENHEKHIYTEMQNIEFVNIYTGGTHYFLCVFIKVDTQFQ